MTQKKKISDLPEIRSWPSSKKWSYEWDIMWITRQMARKSMKWLKLVAGRTLTCFCAHYDLQSRWYPRLSHNVRKSRSWCAYQRTSSSQLDCTRYIWPSCFRWASATSAPYRWKEDRPSIGLQNAYKFQRIQSNCLLASVAHDLWKNSFARKDRSLVMIRATSDSINNFGERIEAR